jgi:hypothetical protein
MMDRKQIQSHSPNHIKENVQHQPTLLQDLLHLIQFQINLQIQSKLQENQPILSKLHQNPTSPPRPVSQPGTIIPPKKVLFCFKFSELHIIQRNKT